MQCSRDHAGHRLSVRSNLTLPDPDHRPPSCLQLRRLPPVALHVALDLRGPVGSVRSSLELPLPLGPVFPVPEVAVTEDSYALTGEDDVWLPREIVSMEPVTMPSTPECLA